MPFETDEMEWVRRLRKTASDRKELPKIRGMPAVGHPFAARSEAEATHQGVERNGKVRQLLGRSVGLMRPGGGLR